MSEYVVCETEFKDLELLKQALGDVGINVDNIEVHDTPQKLHGYQGDTRVQKAHVIIRREHVGSASNDIGFEKTAEGTYRAWVSDYDRHRGLGSDIVTGRLRQHYAKRVILKQTGRVRGFRVTKCEEKDGRVRIKVSG